MDLTKFLKILNSCKTEQHFDVAIKYANLILASSPKGVDYIASNVLLARTVERMLGYTQGRLNVDI